MKERPILMSAPMVRALLAGTKTQTRRIMAVQPVNAPSVGRLFRDKACTKPVIAAIFNEPAADGSTICLCPYGVPGDRLWVRECFSRHLHDEGCWYWADGNIADDDCERPKPSIHMPRWASRILLEITEVRVQRLQEINEEDCAAEGIRYGAGSYELEWMTPAERDRKRIADYRALWEQINGPGSWDLNPWVWAVSFKRVRP